MLVVTMDGQGKLQMALFAHCFCLIAQFNVFPHRCVLCFAFPSTAQVELEHISTVKKSNDYRNVLINDNVQLNFIRILN